MVGYNTSLCDANMFSLFISMSCVITVGRVNSAYSAFGAKTNFSTT